MIPDRLQYFLEHFWNDQKCDQIWTIGPRIYHQNISKIQDMYGGILEHIMFHIWESEILMFWNACAPCRFQCSILKRWSFDI